MTHKWKSEGKSENAQSHMTRLICSCSSTKGRQPGMFCLGNASMLAAMLTKKNSSKVYQGYESVKSGVTIKHTYDKQLRMSLSDKWGTWSYANTDAHLDEMMETSIHESHVNTLILVFKTQHLTSWTINVKGKRSKVGPIMLIKVWFSSHEETGKPNTRHKPNARLI